MTAVVRAIPIVLIAAICAWGSPTPHASPAANPYTIGPEVRLPDDPAVFVLPAAGGRSRRVSALPGKAFDPEWRADGRALAVVTDGAIVELPRAGETALPSWRKRTVVFRDTAWSPTYSPNGTQLAFSYGLDFWVVSRASLKARRLTTGAGADGFLDWSPSGAIAVVRQGNLFVMTSRGRLLRQLTHEGTTMLPAWSPDGRRLAFTRLAGPLSISVTDPNGDVVRRITDGDPQAAYPAWSPDGRKLVYAKYVDESWDLFVLDVARRRERRLTATPRDEVDPAWSPDGGWLAFVRGMSP